MTSNSDEILSEVVSRALYDLASINISSKGATVKKSMRSNLLVVIKGMKHLCPEVVDSVVGQLQREKSSAGAILNALSPDVPPEWAAIGVKDPLEVAKWDLLDMGATQTKTWLKHGLTVDDCYLWDNCMAPEQIVVYQNAGFAHDGWPCNISGIARFDAKSVVYATQFPQVKKTATHRMLFFVAEWHQHTGSFMNPETFDEAMSLSRNMWPDEAAKWDVSFAEIIGWKNKGYNIKEAKKAIAKGLDFQSAPHIWSSENPIFETQINKVVVAARRHKWKVNLPSKMMGTEHVVTLHSADKSCSYKLKCDSQGEIINVAVYNEKVFVGMIPDRVGLTKNVMGIFSGKIFGLDSNETEFSRCARKLQAKGWKVKIGGSGRLRNDTHRVFGMPWELEDFPHEWGWVIDEGESFPKVRELLSKSGNAHKNRWSSIQFKKGSNVFYMATSHEGDILGITEKDKNRNPIFYGRIKPFLTSALEK